MAWNTTEKISSIGDLVKWVDSITLNGLSGLLFRGQAKKSWGLEPTLHRAFRDPIDGKTADMFEEVGLFHFRKSAYLHLDHTVLPEWPPNDQMSGVDILVVWSLMRHYGAPTRVLDWTSSPYVATYFAVREEWDDDASIWFYDQEKLKKAWRKLGLAEMPTKWEDFKNGGKIHEIPVFFDYEPSEQTQRMVAQQCRLTVCTNVEDDHERAIENLAEKSEENNWYWRVDIPAKHKYDLFRHLLSMGISAYALFPGADGLGKYVSEFFQLKAGDLDVLKGRLGSIRALQGE